MPTEQEEHEQLRIDPTPAALAVLTPEERNAIKVSGELFASGHGSTRTAYLLSAIDRLATALAEARQPQTDDPIIWTGDLDDDCKTEWRGMFAHAELMGEGMRPDDPEFDPANDSTTDYWFAAVYRGDVQLMHSGEQLAGHVILTSGHGARLVCELYMRAEVNR